MLVDAQSRDNKVTISRIFPEGKSRLNINASGSHRCTGRSPNQIEHRGGDRAMEHYFQNGLAHSSQKSYAVVKS